MRRPPQSNCPPGTVPLPDYGQRLGPRLSQGGISRLAPPRLAPRLLRLPPILHRLSPNPVPSCSKAPRGLFVLVRVHGIFTATSISPGPSLRQRPARYAIRAGRNLPDKEFRSPVPDISIRGGLYLHPVCPDARRIVSEDPLHKVSCGLPNPCHFYQEPFPGRRGL